MFIIYLILIYVVLIGFINQEDKMQNKNYEKTKQEQQLALVTKVSYRLTPKLPYHNFEHEIDVYADVGVLAFLECFSDKERHLLRTAGLLHDTLFEPDYPSNEERSARVVRKTLPNLPYGLAYSLEDTETVSRVVLATKFPTNPQDKLEKALCDADLANLGKPEFFDKSEQLRQEWNVQDLEKWYQTQVAFLSSHNYYTKSARGLYEPNKKKHLKEMKKRLKTAA
jgi:predicted metal-dependent HD superfamily phosphohydrolase